MKNSLKLVVTNAICMGFLVVSQTVFAQDKLGVSAVPGLAAPLGAPFQTPPAVVNHQSRLILYRAATDRHPGAASVYINGAYHTSLQRGAYSEVCLQPGRFEMAVRMVENGRPVREGFDARGPLILEGGQASFVQVRNDTSNRTDFTVVRPEPSAAHVAKTLLQQHTVSRVPTAVVCEEAVLQVAAPPAPVPPSRAFNLGADALFPLGQSSLQSLSSQGRKSLDDLVTLIQNEFGRRDTVRLHIVGHADRLGTPANNLKLSRERAATIKAYLMDAGFSEGEITTEGRGDREPVVRNCGTTATPATVACLKPNRRVVVNVFAKKNS